MPCLNCPPTGGSYISSGPTQRVYVINQSDDPVDVAAGNVSGVEGVFIQGHNPTINIGTAPEGIWAVNGDYAGFPRQSDAAETVDVISTSNDDIVAGSGAQSVTIYGLGATFEYQEEEVIMFGAVASTSANTWKRVFGARIRSVGVDNVNAGDISVYHTTTTANVFAFIPAGRGESNQANYTVPTGKTLYVTSMSVNVVGPAGAPSSAVVNLWTRSLISVTTTKVSAAVAAGAPLVYNFETPIVLPFRTDLKVLVESVSVDGTSVTAHVHGILVDN